MKRLLRWWELYITTVGVIANISPVPLQKLQAFMDKLEQFNRVQEAKRSEAERKLINDFLTDSQAIEAIYQIIDNNDDVGSDELGEICNIVASTGRVIRDPNFPED